MRRTLHLVVGLLAISFFVKPVWSQVETGTINGSVVDSSGAVIPNATVTVTNLGTDASRATKTSNSGSYTISGLTPARYQIRVEASGFQPFTGKAEVTVGGHVTLDAKLSVSSETTKVEVVASGGAEVNTQTQELSQIVNTQQVSQLPSLTRNPYDFVAISGNVSSGDRSSQAYSTSPGNTVGDQNDTSRGVGFTINGQRSTGTDILLDGVENNDVFSTGPGQTIPIDSVQEYRVITNNFSAQYGRAGGGVVNVLTKSGSNAFHGSAWEFNRLSAYTSNTYDNNANGVKKGNYTRNQFGFDIGGPAIKNKLFFFESTEWLRVRSSANQLSLVPDPAFIALAPANVRSYFATFGKGQPAANAGVITAGQISGTPGGPFSAIPASTPIFDEVSFTSPANAGGGPPTNQYYLNSRVDYNFSDKTQTYVRYALWQLTDANGAVSSTPYPQYNVGDSDTSNSVLWNISHLFNPYIVTNTKLSFTRFFPKQSFDTTLLNAPTLFLYNNASVQGHLIQLPGFFSQFTGTGGLPYGGPQNTIQWNQDLNVTKGNHSMQFGGSFIYIQENRAYGAYGQALEQLGKSLPTGLDGFMTGTNVLFQVAVNPRGALPCAKNYVTGALTQTASCSVTLPATSPSFARSNRFNDWSVYAQDALKITPHLTLNYGVRYEYYGIQHNNNQNLDSNFYYGAGSDIWTQVRNGNVYTVPNSPIKKLWNPQYGTVAPRIGFAYDLFGDGKSSLRGGYGISYERNFGNITYNVIQNPPNYATIQVANTPVTNSNAGPLAGSSGSVALPPTSLRNVDQNIRTAQTQFWSLAIDRQILPRTVVSVQYSAARGTHLYDIKNYNELGAANVYMGDSFALATDGKYHYSRPNNQYSSINNRGSNGDSYYQGANIALQASNLANSGLSLVINYTYSHAIDDISSTFSESNSASNGVGNLGYLNPFTPYLDRGSSDFDIRHRFVVAPIWETPWFRSQRSLKGEILGGWMVSGIYQVRTGTPFSFADSTNSLNAGFGQGIVRYTPSTPIHSYSVTGTRGLLSANNFLLAKLPDAVSFSNSAYGGVSDFGPYPAAMTARNAFAGPGAWNLDMAVSKSFPLREGLNIELRAEGFNVLNHANLYVTGSQNDIGNYLDGTGIQVTGKKGGINGGANDERRFGQFALKVNF